MAEKSVMSKEQWTIIGVGVALFGYIGIQSAQIAEVRSDLGAQIAEVRSDLGAQIAEMRSDLGAQIAEVRSDLGAQIAEVRSDLGAQIAEVRGSVADLDRQVASLRERMARVEARLDIAPPTPPASDELSALAMPRPAPEQKTAASSLSQMDSE